MCPWASGFLKTGKAEKPSGSETCDCKASISEHFCHGGEWVCTDFLQIWVCTKDLWLLSKKGLPVLMSKSVSGEWLLESLGSSEGETFGFVPAGRGGAFGAAKVGLVGKFWNILCCYKWAFCKVLSFNLYSCNKCSVCCQIWGGLQVTLKWQSYSFNESPKGPEIDWNIFFSIWWLVQHFLWPGA